MDEYLARPNARIAYDEVGPERATHTLVVAHSLATSRAWEDEAGILQCGARFRRLVLVIPPTVGAQRAEQAELYRAAAAMVEVRGVESWQRVLSSAAPAPILLRGGWTRPSWVPVQDDLIPAVLRGAAASTFPDDDDLETIRQPTLIVTWHTDPSHPPSTAEHLAARLPDAALEVASTPGDIRSWARRATAFLQGD